MVAIFATASALLTPAFVESFDPEKLASKFVRVEKEFGVKFTKANRTFNIVGHWEAVKNAHKSLMKLWFVPDKAESFEETVHHEVKPELERESTVGVKYKDQKSESKHCTNAEERNHLSETDHTVYRIKGNPKRGRYTSDHGKQGTVPDPVVFLQFQDESYSDHDQVDLDAVLDEFARAPSGKKVKKEELKRILEKNTEQMGRPLNKGLPRGASLPVPKVQDAMERYPPPSLQAFPVTRTSISQVYPEAQVTISNHGFSTIVSDFQKNYPAILIKSVQDEVSGNRDSSSTAEQGHVGLVTVRNGTHMWNAGSRSDLETAHFVEKEKGTKETPATGHCTVISAVGSQIPQHITHSVTSEGYSLMASYRSEKGTTEHQDSVNSEQAINQSQRQDYDTKKTVPVESQLGTQELTLEQKASLKSPNESHNPVAHHNSENGSDFANRESQMQSNCSKSRNRKPVKRKKLPSTCFNEEQEKSGSEHVKITGAHMENQPKGKRQLTNKQPPVKSTRQKARKAAQTNKTPEYGDPNSKPVEASGPVKVPVAEEEENKNQNGEKIEKQTSGNTKSNKGKVYRCTECDYQGCRKKRLTEHMGRVHGLLTENCRGTQEQTTFPCNLCDKSFVFGKDLNRHKKIVHHGQKHFCEVCQKSYKSKYVFDKHKATHEAGYIQPMFPCQICDRQFTTKFSLTCHIKSEHLGLKKTFLCPLCGKSFSQIRSYRQHANVHAGIRPYVCEICGKSFTYDKSLKEHRYMHDDIRRFPCNTCGKAFRQRTCLLIHMKVHKDSKDHICSSCGKGFTQKQSLLRHERIHSGDKPYSCKLCQKSFSDYAVIRKHVLMSHKKNKNDWKDVVITEVKKTSDHYISGGPGYVPREPSSQVREKNFATVIPPEKPGGATVIIDHSVEPKRDPEMVSLISQSTTQPAIPQSVSNTTQVSSNQIVSNNHGSLASSHGNLARNNDSELSAIFQQSNSSLYRNASVASVPDVSMPLSDMSDSAKQDFDAGPEVGSLYLNYANLQSAPSQGFSSANDPTMVAEESMVAAFLKAQGRQPGLVPELLTSLGSLAAVQVTSGEQTSVQSEEHLSYGLPSVALTTSDLSQPSLNPEVTMSTNQSWGYQGYAPFYNSTNFQDFQPSQPN